MSKYITITIPTGCSQHWDDMLQQSAGKHCDACQKTVIDFSNMTDTQLANFFKNNTDKVCGRFHADQLDKEIMVPKKAMPWLKYFFTIGLPAFLFSQKSWGQTSVLPSTIAHSEKRIYGTDDPISSNIKINITGNVSDEKGMAISYATVMIKGTTIGTATDSSGNFTLSVTYLPITLAISSVGYMPYSIVINENDVNNIKLVKLEQQLLGDVVTIVTRTRRKTSKKNTPVLATNSVNIFPNPVSQNSKLTLSWKNKLSTPQLVEIFNEAGSLLQKEIVLMSKNSFDAFIFLKQLPTGFYILKITDTKTRFALSKEFIVQ